MLTSPPFIITPKTSVINFPLLIALFITSVIHLLLIAKLRMDFPEIEQKHSRVFITIVKLAPAPQKNIPSAPPTPVVPEPKPVVAEAAPVQKTEQRVAPLTKKSQRKKRQIIHHQVTPPTPLASPDPVVAENIPIPVTEVQAEVKPVEPVEQPVKPVESVEPVKPIEPVAPVAIPATPVIEAAPPPIAAVIPEPIPTTKVEDNPIVTAPIQTEQATVQLDSTQADITGKPIDLPTQPAKKSPKKSTSKTSPHHQTPLSMDDLAMQIAQVGEKFGNQAPTASENRIKPLSSVRQHKVSARQYILDWQHKVERIGNTNFPEAARQKDFSAQLVMEVGINADGNIRSVRIKKSSGTPALDEAAKNIVRMGEPYAPLPKDLAQELDVLIIQRTWQFSDESGMTTR